MNPKRTSIIGACGSILLIEILPQKKSLPTLNAGEFVDFVIDFNSCELSDKDNLSASVQIWLDGDESKTDEHYWCVWFDIAD